jgi:hypothetical protein
VKKKKRGETKGYFGKDETLCVAGVQKCPAVVTRRNKGILFSFLYSANFLTLTVFLDVLNLAREDGWLSEPTGGQDSGKETFK